jgi:hypothetical protein
LEDDERRMHAFNNKASNKGSDHDSDVHEEVMFKDEDDEEEEDDRPVSAASNKKAQNQTKKKTSSGSGGGPAQLSEIGQLCMRLAAIPIIKVS